MENIKAKEILSEDFEKIDYDSTVNDAIKKFKKRKVLYVFKGKEFKGVLLERKIIRPKLDPKAKIKKFIYPVPKISLDTNLVKIAKLMIENNIKNLPVFDREKMVGIVDQDMILKKVIEKEIGEKRVSEVMTRDLRTTNENDMLAKVINIFHDYDISHLPVVDSSGKLVGIVKMFDILREIIAPLESIEAGTYIGEKKSRLNIPVRKIMSTTVETIDSKARIKEAIERMLSNRVTYIVVTEDGKPAGIVTGKDLLEQITVPKEGKGFYITFSGIETIFEREEMLKELEAVLQKYANILKSGDVFVYFKKLKETPQGKKVYNCRIRMGTEGGFFVATDNGLGPQDAFYLTLDHLERELYQHKDMMMSRSYHKEFLKNIGLWEE
ncbi:MAG: CBS domain-containing protein [Methanomicrobia archaeon]|nr:CBS domain-containing protein [Methanomicrobia archaeon]